MKVNQCKTYLPWYVISPYVFGADGTAGRLRKGTIAGRSRLTTTVSTASQTIRPQSAGRLLSGSNAEKTNQPFVRVQSLLVERFLAVAHDVRVALWSRRRICPSSIRRCELDQVINPFSAGIDFRHHNLTSI